MRAGKVSMEEILEACFRKALSMRTRPRLSGKAAKCVVKCVGTRPVRVISFWNVPLCLFLQRQPRTEYRTGRDRIPILQYS